MTQPLCKSKTPHAGLLAEYPTGISELQSVLHTQGRCALLPVFQGMDTAGQAGAIKHARSGVIPQGCQVFSFEQPGREELDHDFLWRTNERLPERGRNGIFNRSCCEEVLAERVHPEVLRGQRVPVAFVKPKRIWSERHHDIVNLEDYLHRDGTRIIKLVLHSSRQQQRRGLLARMDDPEMNRRMSRADLLMPKEWAALQATYADCLGATNAKTSPWHVVPADDKWNVRLIISQIIVETMITLRMRCPSPPKEHRKELKEMRRTLKGKGRQ